MKRRMLFISLVLVTIVVPNWAFCASASKPVEFKWVSFLPASHISTKTYKIFVDRINELSKGELIIKHIGGPEVIKGMDLAMAVKNGVMDMGNIPAAYYEGLVPGAGILELSQITTEEERRSGAHALLVEMHRKAGLYYVGRSHVIQKPLFYIVFSKKKIEKPEDLAGKVIGASSMTFSGIATGFKSGFSQTPLPDAYTALERGTVDGYAAGLNIFIGLGMQEIIKYVVDHPFFMPDAVTILNLKKWEALPVHLQKAFQTAQVESEPKQAAIEYEEGSITGLLMG